MIIQVCILLVVYSCARRVFPGWNFSFRFLDIFSLSTPRGGMAYFPGEDMWNLIAWRTNDTFSSSYFAVPLTIIMPSMPDIHHITP